MARFSLSETPLAGLVVIERQPIADSRGFLSRLFCAEELAAAGFDRPIAQINHTLTRRRGAVRGMHFQRPPDAEHKLVSCIRGSVFDVAVDIRQGSPTFGRWHAEVLSGDNHRALFIPKGFAHGFQALDEDSELLYLHTAPYVQASEGALHALDPTLEIRWPLDVAEMSPRDAGHPFLTSEFTGIQP